MASELETRAIALEVELAFTLRALAGGFLPTARQIREINQLLPAEMQIEEERFADMRVPGSLPEKVPAGHERVEVRLVWDSNYGCWWPTERVLEDVPFPTATITADVPIPVIPHFRVTGQAT